MAENDEPQDVKPDKPQPDPDLISHLEKGYTPESEKRNK
jgi:hypothetical protein